MTSKSYVYWGAACRQTLVCWCGRVRKPFGGSLCLCLRFSIGIWFQPQ